MDNEDLQAGIDYETAAGEHVTLLVTNVIVRGLTSRHVVVRFLSGPNKGNAVLVKEFSIRRTWHDRLAAERRVTALKVLAAKINSRLRFVTGDHAWGDFAKYSEALDAIAFETFTTPDVAEEFLKYLR